MIFALFSLCLLIGCVSPVDHSVRYAAKDIGIAMETSVGTIVQRRAISLSDSASSSSPGLGLGLGAVAGAALGAAVADHAGVGAFAGGVAGGIVGNAIQQSGKNDSQGWEYTIKVTKSGQLLTVAQPTSVDMSVGQKVIIRRNPQTHVIHLESIPYIDA